MKYIWVEKKNQLNIKKHGVAFDEAMTVLERAEYLSIVDDSSEEERRKAIGYSKKLRLLLVVYLYRDEDIIRIISARKATKQEIKLWQKEKY